MTEPGRPGVVPFSPGDHTRPLFNPRRFHDR